MSRHNLPSRHADINTFNININMTICDFVLGIITVDLIGAILRDLDEIKSDSDDDIHSD